jgi:CheY-like chemotaxis protein
VDVKGETPPRAFILVVEDNPANQMLIKFTLEGGGYQVDVAGSAHEALVSIQRRQPDLILMDIQLPGQDGLSFTRQLKADPALKAIPVVALTARAMVGDQELCLAAGCSGYISKPIDTRAIADEVAHFLSPAK